MHDHYHVFRNIDFSSFYKFHSVYLQTVDSLPVSLSYQGGFTLLQMSEFDFRLFLAEWVHQIRQESE